MTRAGFASFAAGVLFAVGLGLAGMTQPDRVLGFLDVAGDWDPTLAFVMAGAIAVHLAFALRARRGKGAPLFAASYALPTRADIDVPLVAGAALFGLGWGAAGYCPGPAFVSLVTLDPTTVAFVASMLLGMAAHHLWANRSRSTTPPDDEPSSFETFQA